MQNIVDVIIPIYNRAHCVKNLIRELEQQTMQDFRAIFVDDGSEDETYQLLRTELKDVSFDSLVVHQENKGLPGARNTGIRHAEAEWIAFMDSDDGLDPHYLEFLYKGVVQCGTNAGVCGYQTITKTEEVRKIDRKEYSAQVITAAECVRKYYDSWFGACALMLRRQWLQDQNLWFDEACTYLEDVPFITQLIVCVDRIAIIDSPLYLYYMRSDSLMHTPKLEKYKIALDGFDRMAQKVSAQQNEAAKEFCAMGRARYYIAILRKGAVLMPYELFIELCDNVPLKSVKHQLKSISLKFRLAGMLYLISKPLFYRTMRILFRE